MLKNPYILTIRAIATHPQNWCQSQVILNTLHPIITNIVTSFRAYFQLFISFSRLADGRFFRRWAAVLFLWRGGGNKKAPNFSVRGSGGGYLLSHFRSTIGVVRLNFSVRNGKRWIPHAITTLMRLRPLPIVFTALCSSGGRVSSEMHRRTSRE